MHSCWCILLNECGLNSNLHLNSNLFELGIEKEIEKETNPNPIPEAHQLNPVQPRPTPSHFFSPRPNPTRLPGQLASPPRPAQTSPARSRASARVTLSPTPPLTARAHGAEPSPSPVCPAPGCPAPLRPCVACAVDLLNPVAPPASYRAPPTF